MLANRADISSELIKDQKMLLIRKSLAVNFAKRHLANGVRCMSDDKRAKVPFSEHQLEYNISEHPAKRTGRILKNDMTRVKNW